MIGLGESPFFQQLPDERAAFFVVNRAGSVQLSHRVNSATAGGEESSKSQPRLVCLNVEQLFRQLRVAAGHAPCQVDQVVNEFRITLRGQVQISEGRFVLAGAQQYIATLPTRMRIKRSTFNRLVERR